MKQRQYGIDSETSTIVRQTTPQENRQAGIALAAMALAAGADRGELREALDACGLLAKLREAS